jgi:glycosyltransferase involved in cell wall biosynthesis
MSTTPDISIIVAAYNPGKYIVEAVHSVKGQTFTNWELIIVDDGSDEDLAPLQLLDGRIRVVRTPNRGVSSGRNLGVALARAPLLAFLDQDDRWHRGKLHAQLDALGARGKFCCTAFNLIGPGGEALGPGYGGPSSYTDLLAGRFGLLLSSLLCRRDELFRVGLFDPRLAIQQDLSVFMNLAYRSTVSYVPVPQVDYRIHPASASRDYWQAYQELQMVFRMESLRLPISQPRRARRVPRSVRQTYAHQGVDVLRGDYQDRGTIHSLRLALQVALISPTVLGRALIKAAAPTQS